MDVGVHQRFERHNCCATLASPAKTRRLPRGRHHVPEGHRTRDEHPRSAKALDRPNYKLDVG
jgi:hypothetical protein